MKPGKGYQEKNKKNRKPQPGTKPPFPFPENPNRQNQEDDLAWDAEVRANAIKGIIFYIDKTGEHGLIAAGEDLKDTYYWMIAIKACKEYQGGGYSDWRLPSKEELNLLYGQKESVGGFTYEYWSSTEYGKGRAWYQDFNRGHQGAAFETPQRDQKIAKFHVRVIRTF